MPQFRPSIGGRVAAPGPGDFPRATPADFGAAVGQGLAGLGEAGLGLVAQRRREDEQATSIQARVDARNAKLTASQVSSRHFTDESFNLEAERAEIEAMEDLPAALKRSRSFANTVLTRFDEGAAELQKDMTELEAFEFQNDLVNKRERLGIEAGKFQVAGTLAIRERGFNQNAALYVSSVNPAPDSVDFAYSLLEENASTAAASGVQVDIDAQMKQAGDKHYYDLMGDHEIMGPFVAKQHYNDGVGRDGYDADQWKSLGDQIDKTVDDFAKDVTRRDMVALVTEFPDLMNLALRGGDVSELLQKLQEPRPGMPVMSAARARKIQEISNLNRRLSSRAEDIGEAEVSLSILRTNVQKFVSADGTITVRDGLTFAEFAEFANQVSMDSAEAFAKGFIRESEYLGYQKFIGPIMQDAANLAITNDPEGFAEALFRLTRSATASAIETISDPFAAITGIREFSRPPLFGGEGSKFQIGVALEDRFGDRSLFMKKLTAEISSKTRNMTPSAKSEYFYGALRSLNELLTNDDGSDVLLTKENFNQVLGDVISGADKEFMGFEAPGADEGTTFQMRDGTIFHGLKGSRVISNSSDGKMIVEPVHVEALITGVGAEGQTLEERMGNYDKLYGLGAAATLLSERGITINETVFRGDVFTTVEGGE